MCGVPRPMGAAGWRARTELQLVLDQLQALERWSRTRDPAAPGAAATVQPSAVSREQRLDHDRRRQARWRERSALLATLDRQLSGRCPIGPAVPLVRAVVAHRAPWFQDRLAACLQSQGVRVLAVLDDGADALGVTVVEQPDLLLVQEQMPHLSGLEILAASTVLAPRTLLAVQSAQPEHAAALEAAGAGLVVAATVRPADVALRLLARLTGAIPEPAPAPRPVPRAVSRPRQAARQGGPPARGSLAARP